MSVNWSVCVFVRVFSVQFLLFFSVVSVNCSVCVFASLSVSDFVLLLWGVNVSVGGSVYGNVGVSMGVSGVDSQVVHHAWDETCPRDLVEDMKAEII